MTCDNDYDNFYRRYDITTYKKAVMVIVIGHSQKKSRVKTITP